MVSLDRFREVNDAFGHRWGEALLQGVGRRVQRVLRASDSITRLAGDEFAVLVPGADMQGGAVVAGKILHAFEAPFALAGQQVETAASIGIALCPEHGDDAETLLRRADGAMRAAKQNQSAVDSHSAEKRRGALVRRPSNSPSASRWGLSLQSTGPARKMPSTARCLPLRTAR